MFKFQYKERTYAKEILSKGFTSKHIKYELQLLVKYYKELGHKPKERKELIYNFCEKYLEGFDRVIHFKLINSILNHGSNRKNILVEIDSIDITVDEFAYIDNLDIDHEHKKVVFTLLVLDKLNKKYHEIRNELQNNEHYFGGSQKYKELISSSKVSLKKNNLIHNTIGKLGEKGIVQITGNSSIKLSFVYEIPESVDVSISIKTFDSIGYYYDLHTGENKIKKCENCEIPIKVTNNKSKYCNDCAKEINRLKTLENYHNKILK